ncbi:MAG: outer membrane beta-barrel protein [Pseudomonadota bacterium]|uniref:outer membrane beta-barrel protein n=1 Tax=Phenylobacterium sp. TaxID=1871053 RepID=UPI0025E68930|nr:outer membrane beta-barrel protein [Phenylobacterium sp.]MBT9471366.1 outer membrane beta-barrel protein [Phenylobacterium sp.]
MVQYWAAAAMVGAVTFSSAASAQETRRLDFGAHASVFHDSNVARTDETLAAQRGIEPEDVIFTPSLRFDLLLPISRQSFFLNGTAGYDFHRENNQLDSERFNVSSGLNGQLGPCRGTLMGGYTRAQGDLQDLTLINPENTREVTSVNANVSCARPTGLGLQLSAGHEWANNSNVLQAQSDYESSSGQVGVTYGRPTFGVLTVFAQRQRTEYDNRIGLGSTPGYDMTAAGVSFERRLGARIEGTLSLSYSWVDPLTSAPGGAGEYTGTTYGADFVFRPTERLETLFTYERSIVPSTRIGKLYDIQEDLRLEARYQLGARFQVGLGGRMLDSTSEGSTLVGVNPGLLLTDSRTKVMFGSLTFKQSQRTSIRLDVSREEREANIPTYEYSTTRVGLTADVAF